MTKAPSVFVCMPTYDTMQVATCLSLLQLMDKFTQAKIKSTVSTFKCPYVGYGRNILSAMFMASDFDYQLFVDADVEFDPKDVGRMIVADKDMICVPYRKKTQDNTIKFSVAFENFNDISIDKHGLTEIIGGPAGLTLIKRTVYKSLIERHPELKINSADGISDEAKKYMYNFWENTFDSKQGHWFGEDVSFCNLARNAGHKFYAVVDGVTTHHGNFGYKGSLIDSFKKADEKPIKIFGPPGTGKTFRLIRRVNAYIRTGTPYHKIGYFAFTRKAAGEARKRIGVDEKQAPYFQTLHAFCFHLLNKSEEDIIQPHHYEDLGKMLNVRVNFTDKYNEEETHFLTCNNPYFQMIQKAINKGISIREEYDLNDHDRKDIYWPTLKHIDLNLQEYKKKNHLLDFNDLITQTIECNKIPKFKAIFIDEAQDLSPLQWKLYDKLKERCDDMYLAGDDDQAIFAWAGADVNRFIKEPATEKVLRYSRRVSKAVQQQSQIAVDRIAGIRKHKEYLPREEEGHAQHINNLGQIDLTKGKWLILTRTKSNLLEIAKELKSKNIYYQTNKGKSFNVGMYTAAMAYTKWIREGQLEDKEINDVRDYIPNGNWNPEKNWYDIFVGDQKEILYIRNIIFGGEKLSENARVWLSTIHAAKGGEEDNVILSLHQGGKVQKSIRLSVDKQDEENRVWYVGITRARNNLYKLKAKNIKGISTMMEYAYSFHYWGPLLFKTKLNDEDLIKVKNICKKDSAKKYVEYLAGDIEHEYQIDKIILDRILQPYMFLFKQAYSNWYQEDIKGNIYVTNAWVNYMKPGDYNPVHTHDKCDFSAVVYIDIPKELRKEIDEYKGQSDGPGAINFLYGEFNPYFISQICGKPNVAELYMFPYGLRHMVNPHKSNCERVSVGINFAIKGERHDT